MQRSNDNDDNDDDDDDEWWWWLVQKPASDHISDLEGPNMLWALSSKWPDEPGDNNFDDDNCDDNDDQFAPSRSSSVCTQPPLHLMMTITMMMTSWRWW